MSEPDYEDGLDVPPDECHACNYKTTELHKVRARPGSEDKSPFYFCDFCYRSFAGNAAQHPSQYGDMGLVVRHICLIANMMIDRLNGDAGEADYD